jgi:4-amino-4-deoxy-L-arabinose transferase-like glycosyltransferase
MAKRRDLLTLAALALLVLVASGLRLYRLETLPAGLHHDEASNGMLALDILTGDYPVFFSAYTGKEAGYMYLIAPAIRLLGQTVLAIRLPAALAGVALVGVLFLVGQQMMGRAGGLLAAGVAAGAPWLLHINRIGFRASLLPLLLTLWVWFLLRAMAAREKPTWLDWMAAGGCLGAAAHTYTSSRIVPLLVVLYLGTLAFWHRPLLRHVWRGFLLMLGVALLVAAPLLLHYLHHPHDWGERLEQIGACGGDVSPSECVGRVARHTWATLLMVGVRGDPLGFFNLPGQPALPLFAGWLFYVGGLLALRRIREPTMALLLLWWGVMVVPGILSRDSPHFLRTIGAAPPTMLLWALPLASIIRRVGGRYSGKQGLRSDVVLRLAVPAFAVLLVLSLMFASSNDYFGRWAQRPDLYYEYMGYATDAAARATQVEAETALFISEQYYRHPTYLYLAPRTTAARWFDARYGLPLPPSGRSVYLISPATPVDRRIDAFLRGAMGKNILNQRGQYTATVLTLAERKSLALPTPARPFDVAIGGLQFEGATIGPTDGPTDQASEQATLPVTLFWRVHSPTRRDLRVFLHLVDGDGAMMAQHDVLGYPSREWRVDDAFVTFHTLPLPHTSLPVRSSLHLGLYDVKTGERMPCSEGKSNNNALIIPLRD